VQNGEPENTAVRLSSPFIPSSERYDDDSVNTDIVEFLIRTPIIRI
jgi:hypothetical protein